MIEENEKLKTQSPNLSSGQKNSKSFNGSSSKLIRRSVQGDKAVFDFLIAGVPYKLKTAHEEVFVEELVQLVNARMQQALSLTKNGSFQNAAVLTAMNLAEELVLLKKRTHRDLEKLEEKALKIALDLENSKNFKSASKERPQMLRSSRDGQQVSPPSTES